MKVDILNYTPNADRTVVACARGDYMEGSLVGVDLADEESYGEIVESVGYDDEDAAWATDNGYETFTATDGGGRVEISQAGENEAKTRAFIRQLLRRGHFGPTEHASITFAVEGVSRSCMAQMTRHRHASFDVQSQRYVDFDDTGMVTPESFGEVDKRVDLHPDGYVSFKPVHDDAEAVTRWVKRESSRLYKSLVKSGVPKEDARMVLPIGTKVNLTATFNLRSLMHVLDLRENMKAQAEARELASEMRESAKEVAPHTIEMYEEHINNNSLRAP